MGPVHLVGTLHPLLFGVLHEALEVFLLPRSCSSSETQEKVQQLFWLLHFNLLHLRSFEVPHSHSPTQEKAVLALHYQLFPKFIHWFEYLLPVKHRSLANSLFLGAVQGTREVCKAVGIVPTEGNTTVELFFLFFFREKNSQASQSMCSGCTTSHLTLSTWLQLLQPDLRINLCYSSTAKAITEECRPISNPKR